MKVSGRSTATWATLLLALVATGAGAQSVRPLARVQVPWSFHYGDRLMPAGEYRLSMQSDVFLSFTDGVHTTFGMVRWERDPSVAHSHAALRFQHSGNDYTLTEFVSPEHGARIKFAPLKRKRGLQPGEALKELSSISVEIPLVKAGN